MREYETAAPLHNGIYLSAMEIFRSLRPALPLIAVFETSFHRTMPDEASYYGVPGDWVEQFGVRKYGFHGASHRYVSERVPEILGRPPVELQLVSCHLGGSSSICAVDGGRSVDTTMGFSPQSGIENATRHGDLDVFAVLTVMDRLDLSPDATRKKLLSGGGLAGLSGIAGGDVRDLERAAAQGNARACLALDTFAYEIRKTVGAFAAAMGGLNALAFTGGIGENSTALRAAVCRELDFLGIRLDPVENVKGSGDRLVSYRHRPGQSGRPGDERGVDRRPARREPYSKPNQADLRQAGYWPTGWSPDRTGFRPGVLRRATRLRSSTNLARFSHHVARRSA